MAGGKAQGAPLAPWSMWKNCFVMGGSPLDGVGVVVGSLSLEMLSAHPERVLSCLMYRALRPSRACTDISKGPSDLN